MISLNKYKHFRLIEIIENNYFKLDLILHINFTYRINLYYFHPDYDFYLNISRLKISMNTLQLFVQFSQFFRFLFYS